MEGGEEGSYNFEGANWTGVRAVRARTQRCKARGRGGAAFEALGWGKGAATPRFPSVKISSRVVCACARACDETNASITQKAVVKANGKGQFFRLKPT